MLRTESTLAAHDGSAIPLFTWQGGGPPRAVVQLAHGMGEHVLRYEPLAAALTTRGHALVANNHRGHGEAARDPAQRGEFGPGGFPALVQDLATVTAHIRQRWPGVPVVLLGHSMGSFAAQVYVLDHASHLAGLVLSGTAATDLLMSQQGPQRKLEDYAGAASTAA